MFTIYAVFQDGEEDALAYFSSPYDASEAVNHLIKTEPARGTYWFDEVEIFASLSDWKEDRNNE